MPTTNQPPSSGILMILSPAKTLDLTPLDTTATITQGLPFTQPDCHPEQTHYIAHCMKQRTPTELAKLLSLSNNLAQTAASYWKAFDTTNPDDRSSLPNTKPCIFAFSGAAYQGLDIATCNPEALPYLQTCLRIMDPLYGVLRPLDLIQPYRLEMAAKHVLLDDKKNVKLADYWKPVVTSRLSNDLQQFVSSSSSEEEEDDSTTILLNLASDEYSVAVDAANLPPQCRFIKVVFQEPNGRVVAVHAKRARGLMVRYLSQIQATTTEQIQQFALEGYAYQANDSNDTTFVFQRKLSPLPAKSVASKSKRATTSTTTKTTTASQKPAAKRARTQKQKETSS